MHHGTTNVNHMQLREYQTEAIDNLRNIRTISNSNPIPAIELAINFYGRKY